MGTVCLDRSQLWCSYGDEDQALYSGLARPPTVYASLPCLDWARLLSIVSHLGDQGTTKCPLLLLCLSGSHLSTKTQFHCLWTVFKITQSELSRCFARKPLLWHRACCSYSGLSITPSPSWAIQGQGLGLVLVYIPGAQHWAWSSKYPAGDCCEREEVDEGVSLCS